MRGGQHIAEHILDLGQRGTVQAVGVHGFAIAARDGTCGHGVAGHDDLEAQRRGIACGAGHAGVRHEAADDHGGDATRAQLVGQVGADEGADAALLHHGVARARLQAGVELDGAAIDGEHGRTLGGYVLDVEHGNLPGIGPLQQAPCLFQGLRAARDGQAAAEVLVLEVDDQQRRGTRGKWLRPGAPDRARRVGWLVDWVAWLACSARDMQCS